MSENVGNFEALLPNLNRALRSLRGAMTFLNAPEIEDQLTSLMRRLFIAELLSQSCVITIAGTQGAGKTTLASLMYDLHLSDQSPEDRWLNGNEGRGERMPVLLLEDPEIQSPQGFIRRLVANGSDGIAVLEESVDQAGFRTAITGGDKTCLLPVLRLPRRYFSSPEQAFLLLPGYEAENDSNRDWQSLMRQTMIAATGTIVVTDRTRLANADGRKIVADMKSQQLGGMHPIVVISKSESILDNDGAQRELRDVAADMLDIASDEAERRILCTSTAPTHVERWQQELKSLVANLAFASNEARQRQVGAISKLLQDDLSNILVETQFRLNEIRGQSEDASNETINHIGGVFDAAKDRVGAKYKKQLDAILKDHLAKAIDIMDGKLITDFEGLQNKLPRLLDSATEKRQAFYKAVLSSWNEAGNADISQIPLMAQVSNQEFQNVANRALSNDAKARLATKLPANSDQQTSDWDEFSIGTLADLKTIFYASRDEIGTANSVSKDLQSSIRLLPALTLEYLRQRRLHQAPAALEIDHPETDLEEAGKRVHQGFIDFAAGHVTTTRAIAMMFALDGAVDGKFDTIPALLGAVGISGTAATIMTGGAIAGLLGVLVMKEINRHDTKVSIAAHGALSRIKEHILELAPKEYDEAIADVRDRLMSRLTVLFRLDETLMRRYRLEKALADVSSLKMDAQDLLGNDISLLLARS